jgi:predicted nucleic acid-binding protein
MKPPERVVFDCNVFFQAFVSATGPAGELLNAVSDKKLPFSSLSSSLMN